MSQSVIDVNDMIPISGHVKGRENIKREILAGVINAVFEGTQKGFMLYQRNIALETGAFRGVTRESIGAVVGKSVFGKSKIVIPWEAIESMITSSLDYSKYHIRGHPQQAFFGQYKNPTTPGTEPLNPKQLMALMRENVRKEIKGALTKRGLNVR
ncbi:hypothetical protein LCGC14_1257430 [marine sediment metagenome]|uniref:Uncharacterized protein n=1 Tax=marine sediment metagenome TaxID=412755 RepID=A0A0F9NID2_9ZZZZ